MSKHEVRRFFFVVVLLLGAGSPAVADVAVKARPAAIRPISQAVVRADVWSLGHFFTAGGRTRIVQLCIVAMCLALFIMMKKVNG